MEWIWIRHAGNHNCDVKQNSKSGEGDEDPCDREIDGPRVLVESSGEEKGQLEYDRKTFNE